MKLKFYAHLVFPETSEMSDMLRSIDIVVDAVNTVAKVFKGKVIYDGDGSETVQYNDVVEFENLSDIHEEAILRNYPFARKKLE